MDVHILSLYAVIYIFYFLRNITCTTDNFLLIGACVHLNGWTNRAPEKKGSQDKQISHR